MNKTIKFNESVIELYKERIKNAPWTINESQITFFQREIKFLIKENIEIARNDIIIQWLESLKWEKVERQPLEIKEEIWDLNSKEIFKFRPREEVDMEKLEERSLEFIN